jgi:hypothetical protein
MGFRFYGFEPDHGLAERGAEGLAFRVRERGLPGLADRACLLPRIRGGRVLHERIEDGKEIGLAAPVRLAVALHEASA